MILPISRNTPKVNERKPNRLPCVTLLGQSKNRDYQIAFGIRKNKRITASKFEILNVQFKWSLRKTT